MFEDRKIPQISICIPSWFADGQHGKSGEHECFWFAVECLDRLLDTIKNERDRYEVIIVDNGSQDLTSKHLADSIYRSRTFPAWQYLGSDAVIKSTFDPERYWSKADLLIRNDQNLGFAPACNQAFMLARGEYVVCLNNDVLVWKGWADRMIEPFSMEMNPPAGVVMPALVQNSPTPLEALKLEDPILQKNYDSFGAHAEFGSMWMAKRQLLKDIAANRDGFQVFDEEFKGFFKEDRWLWKEIRERGYETYRTHRTRVYHRGNMTVSKVPDRKKYSRANRELFEKRLKEESNDQE